MSWSTELWDQFDTISSHTAKGIEFLDKLGHFIKDRCIIETEYASKLRKLAKSYDLKKKDDEKEFTYCKAFSQTLRELTDQAGQHEVIAENLSAQIVKEITTICKDLREERKRHLNEGVKYQNLLTTSLNQLDKSKKSYDKSFRDAEKAHDNYQKADKDLNLSRAELEKAKLISLTKERACEHSKTDYADQLQVANQAQREHYSEFMPKVFQQLQDMENRRVEYTKNLLKLSANIQKNVMPIINRCLDGVIDSANSIDPAADAQLVIDRFKSGMQPPDDIPFEDLSAKTNCETDSVSTTQSKGSSLMYSHSLKSESFRHTFTARGLKKRTRLLNIFGAKNDCSVSERRKKIQAKIEQLNSQISQANGVKRALINMRQAYEENGAFGDPKTIESQLRENQADIDRLEDELKKHLVLLEELDKSNPSTTAANTMNNNNKATGNNYTSENETLSKSPSITNSNHRASIGPESELSRTNSDNSLRPDSNNRPDGTKSSATNRTSNSFNDSISDSISNNAVSNSAANDTIDGIKKQPIEQIQQQQQTLSQTVEDSTNDTNTSTNSANIATNNNNNAQGLNSSEGYEAPSDLPVQAYARALYPFKAEPTGSISMDECEQFDVIEYDQGDGWTRVRRKNFNPEDDDFIGFVPTSYISIDQITTINSS